MAKPVLLFVGVACGAVIWSLFALWGTLDGLSVSAARVGSIPVTIFRSHALEASPVVVIAHGFADSQQLMQPIAITLARNGYTAVTFDFAGHGRNPLPLPGGLSDLAVSTRALLAEIGEVAGFAMALPGSDGRLALVGHSMASDLVVQYAMNHPGVSAVVALSLFGQGVTPNNPKNLIVIDGAWESSALTAAGFRIISDAAKGNAKDGVTYGELSQGSGRRLVLAAGSEHIGVLYNHDALREALEWLNASFGREGAGFVDSRGKWLALLFIGLIALARPASRLLPQLATRPLGSGLPWRRLLPICVAPAILTPLLLWKAPTSFLPILLGDYLVVHFALYGLLTGAGLWLTQYDAPRPAAAKTNIARVALAASAVAAFYIVALGLPLDAYVTSFAPTGVRWLLAPAMFAGAALYFVADEWLTRGCPAARGGYVFSKTCFVISLGISVWLSPQRLFFLIVIVPVVILLFTVYGLVGRWVYLRTKDPRVGALGAACGLAYAIAVTFPIVG
jgi:dienelactone hydrolase